MKDKITYYYNKSLFTGGATFDELIDDYYSLESLYKDGKGDTDVIIAHCNYRIENKIKKLQYSLTISKDLEDLLNLCERRKLCIHQFDRIEELLKKIDEVLSILGMGSIDLTNSKNKCNELYSDIAYDNSLDTCKNMKSNSYHLQDK